MDQNGITQLAKKTAGMISSRPYDTIEIPFVEQYSQRVEYEGISIEGWILYTFYSYCDSVQGSRDNPIKDKEVVKYYYTLKKDGSLVVYKIGFTIEFAGTDHERLDLWSDLQEIPMNFSSPGQYSNGRTKLSDLVKNCSAYAMDYKHIKWKNSNRISGSKIDYFTRNIPYSEGNNPDDGESFSVHKPGGGLVKALNKLMNEKNSLAQKEKERIRENTTSNINNKEESVMENGFYCPKCHSIVQNLYFECDNCGFDLTENELLLLSPLTEDDLIRIDGNLKKTHEIVEKARELLEQPISDDLDNMKSHLNNIKGVSSEIDMLLGLRS